MQHRLPTGRRDCPLQIDADAVADGPATQFRFCNLQADLPGRGKPGGRPNLAACLGNVRRKRAWTLGEPRSRRKIPKTTSVPMDRNSLRQFWKLSYQNSRSPNLAAGRLTGAACSSASSLASRVLPNKCNQKDQRTPPLARQNC